MWSTEVGQCIVYSGKIYVQKISSTVPQVIYKYLLRWAAMLYADQTFRVRHRCGPLSDLFRYIGENVVLLHDVSTHANELNLFCGHFVFGPREGHRPFWLVFAFCVPFCLWASARLLLAGLNFCIRIFVALFLLTVMYHRLLSLLGVYAGRVVPVDFAPCAHHGGVGR